MKRDNMSGWCDTCFCFRDVQRAITAIGMLSLGCPIIEIFVAIAVFTGVNEQEDNFSVDGDTKEAITYQLYIAFAVVDFLLIIFSIMVLYGNERTDALKSRTYLLPWVILIPFYIIYESAINIYYFYYQFNDKYEAPLKNGHPLGFTIVPLVYWIVKDVLLFISFVFVLLRIRQLTPIVEYVPEYNQGCGCGSQGASVSPAMSLPAPVSFSGGCSSGACGRALPQPAYGYYGGGQTANVTKTGWTTSVYNNSRHYH